MRGDAGEQAAGGFDREVAVVGQAEVEAAGHVVVVTVAEVAGDEGGGEVRGDDDDVPLARERVVGVEGGAADARGGFGGEADAEGADERGVGGEPLVAGGAARREVAGVLEGGEDDGGLALGGDLGLEVLGDREQELLGAAAGAEAGGDGVVRAARAGGAALARGEQRGARGGCRRQRAGAAEEPALAVAGAEGAGDLELLARSRCPRRAGPRRSARPRR